MRSNPWLTHRNYGFAAFGILRRLRYQMDGARKRFVLRCCPYSRAVSQLGKPSTCPLKPAWMLPILLLFQLPISGV